MALISASPTVRDPSTTTTTTPLPSPSPDVISSPLPSPTPSVRWYADVIELKWDSYDSVAQPKWLDNNVVQLSTASDGYFTADISTGQSPQVVQTFDNSVSMAASPNNTFTIACDSNLSMYRSADQQLISTTPLSSLRHESVNCSIYIAWAADETMAAFIDENNAVYIWPSDGSAPKKVVAYATEAFPAWSPDSSKLATVVAQANKKTAIVSIIDQSGTLLSTFQFPASNDSATISWLTNTVLEHYAHRWKYYYDASSGQFLFSRTGFSPGDQVTHEMAVSPDQRWVFMDENDQLISQKDKPGYLIVQKQYTLYDLQTKQRRVLLNHLGNYLGFAGWSTDGTKLYIMSRPADESARSHPSTPFGLLAYDLKTHQFQSLFPNAIQVTWNVDQSWAFVIFTSSTAKGSTHLEAGLWRSGTQTVLKQIRIADKSVYQDPVYDVFFGAFPGPVSVAWAHNQQQLALIDDFGQLRVLNIDGSERILATDLESLGARFLGRPNITIRWAPDDKHMLIVYGDLRVFAWVLDTSAMINN